MPEIHDIYLESIPISEMDAGVEDYVPLDPSTVNKIKKEMEDDNPQFPVIRVESRESVETRSSGRLTFSRALRSRSTRTSPSVISGTSSLRMTNGCYRRRRRGGSKASHVSEGDKTVLYVKGYNLPDEPIRRYVKAGVVNSVSWHGKAAVHHVKGGVQRVKEFALESIDWSRKGKAAMSARLVTVAAEMESGEEESSVTELAKVTVSELKAENPSLYQLIVNETEAAQEEKIEKLEADAQEVEDHRTLFAKIREALHIDDKVDVLEAIVAVQTKLDEIGKKNIAERLTAILSEKIKDDNARAVVTRLMPVSEMEDLDDEALKKKVNETIDSDESIKAIVNRFTGSPGPLKNREINEMGGNGRYDSGKETSNVKVTRTKL